MSGFAALTTAGLVAGIVVTVLTLLFLAYTGYLVWRIRREL